MSRSGRILIVDDETDARSTLAALLREAGFEVETATDAHDALARCNAFGPHVVVTDLETPGVDGLELVEELCAMEAPAAVVVVTASTAVASAVEAMRAGATEHLRKPINADELLLVLDKLFEARALACEARRLRARVRDRVAQDNLVGSSLPMQRLFEIVDRVAPTKATVLISGESGTGKELVANTIHERSPRANGPFLKLHCAALAESLLESELFGHEKDSFAGATSRKDGRLTLADGGTLFLDEIGEMSPAIQVKLLRFLQEREFERVGGARTLQADVRIIAATSRDLTQEVAQGRFREDLFYRLNVVALEIPPLRERRTDIPALAKFFLDRHALENTKQIDGVTPATLELLVSYHWPGNVRELENAIERAVVLTTTPVLEAGLFPTSVQPPTATPGVPTVPNATLAELERYAILETLKATGGSTSKAAAMLGISVRTIQYRLQHYKEAPRSEVESVHKRAAPIEQPSRGHGERRTA